MTLDRRNEILSKMVITIEDFAELHDCAYSTAGNRINAIKRKVGDRIQMKGRLHILDYCTYMNTTLSELCSVGKQ